ncbi:MAG TPA: ATP-dependent RecD-like DNA helicase [Thermoanaerobacterales bacterium]|nr:ATP-dependent RecD-like DNA helicase [Thermoanaerobacterales bacterium]
MHEIEGIVERITYFNERNNYAVAKIQRKNEEYLTTIVGNFHSLNIGETLKLKGKWVNHTDYGTQFQVESYMMSVPATLNGIERYLSSGLIKGIGPVTAKKIVDIFGLDTLEIIQYNPEKLLKIDGIGDKKLKVIIKAYEEQKDIQDVMIFLQSNGVSPTFAVKIYKQYKEKTIEYIQENPYRLADEVFGIGFKTADKIAQKLGIDSASMYRIKSGIKYNLSQFSNQGHTYVPYEKLIDQCSEMLEVKSEVITEAIRDLIKEEMVFPQELNEDGDIGIYLAPFYHAEKGVSDKIYKLASLPCKKLDIDFEEEIKSIEEETKVELGAGQKKALKMILDNNVLIITGGPGTGKTTTINSIMKLMDKYNMKVLLTAPTGRAAKRMTETSGREAKTIHRLLEYSFLKGEGMSFNKNEDNPLNADVVVVDEASMVDLILMYNLLKAIKFGTRLILVGDGDQLPSVGAGSVLNDIIESGCVPVVHLDEIFRQAQESMIVLNAHRINKGEFPLLNKDEKDFFFVDREDPQEILEIIIQLCSARLPRFNGCHPIDDIQVLTPMRRTLIGVNILNENLQKALNPPSPSKKEKKYGNEIFRVGDKVMQIKNNYNKEVFNGDIGKIIDIDEEESEIKIRFPDTDGDRDIIYESYELEELTLSYAVSVHKSQGSEYPVIVMPISTQHYLMLQRNLLYTAITRAKELVVLVGTKKALAIAVKNNKIADRYSYLHKRIISDFQLGM